MKKMYEIENTLRDLLRKNIVVFTYRKVNGELRHAIGTRNLTLAENYTDTRIPTPTGDMQPNSYYDVQSNGWRSWKTGYVISIDGLNPTGRVNGFLNTDPNYKDPNAKMPKTPVREIPISKPTTGGVSGGKPMGGGADIDNLATNLGLDGLGDFFGGLFGGGIPKDEIRKSMDKLGKDIDIVPPTGGVSGGKVGTPTFTDKGLELEMGISVEDFAKMVAHYAVEEFISRIK